MLRPFRGALALGALFVCVDAATSLAAPLLIRRGIDRGVVEASTHALWVTCLIFLAVQLVSWANAVVMTFQTSRTAERVLLSLRVRTFAHLQRLSLDYYDDQMAGRIMTRMTSDIDAFAQLVQQGLLTALVSVLSCLGVAVVLVVLDAPLALAVSIVLPPLIVATVWFRRRSSRAYLLGRDRVAVLYADMQESLSGSWVTQAFARQDRNEEHFGRLADDYAEARRRSIEMIARYFPFIQLVSTVAKAVALGFGAHEVANGSLTPGVLIAFLLYLDQFFTPVQQLSNVFDQWLQAGVAIEQLDTLLDTPLEHSRRARADRARTTDRGDPLRRRVARLPQHRADRGERRRPRDPGRAGGGARRHHRRRQVDARQARGPLLRPHRRAGHGRRHPGARPRPRRLPPPARLRAPGAVPVLGHRGHEHRLRGQDGRRSRHRAGGAGRRRPRPDRLAAPRLPHADRRRGPLAVGRAASAASASPGPSSSTRRSSCSTRRRPTSTSPPRPGCRRRWGWSPGGAPPS